MCLKVCKRLAEKMKFSVLQILIESTTSVFTQFYRELSRILC